MSYNDGLTPTVSYQFDRRGRQTGATNGTSTCKLTLNDAGKVLVENNVTGILGGICVTNGFDQYLRRTNLVVLNGSTVQVSNSFSFDAASRLNQVSDGTNSATYSYVANSPLVGQILFTNGGALRMTTTKQFDFLNRQTNVSSFSPLFTTSFAYGLNPANQATSVTNADGTHWIYTYDSLGQVTSGKKYWSDGTPVAGQQFEYTFDDIGNRRSAGTGGDQTGSNLRYQSYSPNTLNQYISRTVPAYFDILGSAASNATVTIWTDGNNFVQPYRHGDYFRGELQFTNSSSSVWASISNVAVLPNGTNADIVSLTTGNAWIPQTPETFGYDPDGNMTNDGRWRITWDGENRATTFKTAGGAPQSRQQIACDYDHRGRRTQKVVYDGSTLTYVPTSTNRFVYDGWNLIAILNETNGLVSSFMWGTDASGKMQEAGGVGGLLAMNLAATKNAGTYFYAYDGSFNIAGLTSANDGSTSAQYEYGPFGLTIRATGPAAAANPFRFSTKYQDIETDLLFYGYRDYNPGTGRWHSRDPIAEEGGANLYGFVGNTPINAIDPLGLAERTVRYVGKSFINGIGPLGSLGSRRGFPVPPGLGTVNGVDLSAISGSPQYADQRLAIYASVIPAAAHALFEAVGEDYNPFNQNPGSDAKDGEYRLYGKVEITASCCGSILTSYSYETDEEGGQELPGISGTINMDVDASRQSWGFSPTSASVTWKTWGRPNLLAEPGMQWVAFRSSVNIWHEGKVQITCSAGTPQFTILTFRGSRYPSRRLWQDGTIKRNVRQGSFSDLWQAQPGEPTMVAE